MIFERLAHQKKKLTKMATADSTGATQLQLLMTYVAELELSQPPTPNNRRTFTDFARETLPWFV